MTIKIQKWGNSQGIRIPKVILDELNISEKDELEIKVEDNKILIEKIEQRKNIKELFHGFDGEYKSVDVDWGDAVGEEIW